MKNILLLTSVYPADDLPKDNTSVVHYFAKEWVELGYNVIVIHNIKYYPKIVHLLIRLFKPLISRNYDYPFPLKQNSDDRSYTIDNVRVYRMSVYKKMPKQLISEKSLKKQLNKITALLDSINFIPDIITGHWPEPQLYLIENLKKKYNSRTCLVMHNDIEVIRKTYGNATEKIMKSVDIWGFKIY